MQWLRLYHDTINDPKWRVISIRSKQPVGNVLAVWMQMLVCASEATERGTLEGWDDETSAAVLGYDPDAVTAIREAMQGRVLDGLRLTGWEKRQMASDTSAERTRRYRAKNTENNGGDGGGTAQSANGAYDRHGDTDVTSQTETVTSQKGNVTVNVTSPPLRATDSRLEEDSIPPVDPIEPAAAPTGAAGFSVVYLGKAFTLNAKDYDGMKKRCHALQDFHGALQTMDQILTAEMGGKPAGKIYAALNAKMFAKHELELRIKAERAAKQAAKPKPFSNRAGIRNLGPSSQAGAA
jgi:hypothetical protein